MIIGWIQNENQLENQGGSHAILENFPTLVLICIAHVILTFSSLLVGLLTCWLLYNRSIEYSLLIRVIQFNAKWG